MSYVPVGHLSDGAVKRRVLLVFFFCYLMIYLICIADAAWYGRVMLASAKISGYAKIERQKEILGYARDFIISTAPIAKIYSEIFSSFPYDKDAKIIYIHNYI